MATTLLDITKANGSDMVVGLIDETTRGVPEVSGRAFINGAWVQLGNVGAARTIKGRQFKTLVRTALPAVGFRNANDGPTAGSSQYENRTVETYIFNPRSFSDRAVADSYEDGAQAWIALEASGMVEAGMQALGRQFYYGAATASNSVLIADAQGHPGLIDYVDSSMVYDATGSTSHGCTSVWAVKFGPRDVSWVYGQNGSLIAPDVRLQDMTGNNSKPLTCYLWEMTGYPGLQSQSKYSCACIKNISAQSGHTLTDAMLYQLIAKFPSGWVPDAFFANRAAIEQLRESRTTYNPTGSPAPTPVDISGIPLIPTDSITFTEEPR